MIDRIKLWLRTGIFDRRSVITSVKRTLIEDLPDRWRLSYCDGIHRHGHNIKVWKMAKCACINEYRLPARLVYDGPERRVKNDGWPAGTTGGLPVRTRESMDGWK